MTENYYAKKAIDGGYHVLSDDGEHVGYVSKFAIVGKDTPMVSIAVPTLLSPAMARAVARAMTYVADDIEMGRT